MNPAKRSRVRRLCRASASLITSLRSPVILGGRRLLLERGPVVLIPPPTTVRILPPQSLQPLLLGVRVDIRADDEAEEVEERHPGFVGEEGLGEGQGDGRRDPGDLHDGHEAGADGGADLVESAGAGDDGHGGQVDYVLDWGDLEGEQAVSNCKYVEVAWGLLTIRLETMICIILARRLVLFAKSLCRMLIIKCPRGALMKAPYRAILGTRLVK